jgi:two-component system sensor histidine kinase BaeS
MMGSLKTGFGAYVAARDAARLEQFAAYTAIALPQFGGLEAMVERPGLFRKMMDDQNRPFSPLGRPGPEGPSFGPPPLGPPPPRADGFERRLALLTPQGQWVAGHRPQGGDQGLIAPVVVNGQTIAKVELLQPPGGEAPVDAEFLRQQYGRIALMGAVLIILAIGVSVFAARALAKPLLAVRQATSRISRGDFSTRIAPSGALELVEMIGDINQMVLELDRQQSGRRRWLAEIAHELRTPLTILTGELDALIDGVRPVSSQALESFQEELARLNGLVEDLHVLSMSDLNALSCTFEDLDIVELLGQIVERHRPRLAGAEITLDWRRPDTPVEARWDPQRIEQLMLNLLENSRRHTRAPGRASLRIEVGPDRIVIQLDDTAPGVAIEHLGHLGEPLFRTDEAREKTKGGSGLGLAVCRAIAASHGGRLEFTPSGLGGLCVRIDLPRHPA